MAVSNVARIVQRHDALLKTMENTQVAEFQRLLRVSQGRLETQLKNVYQDSLLQGASESILWRENRARLMLEDLDRVLGEYQLGKRLPANQALRTAVEQAQQLGKESAREVMSLISPGIKGPQYVGTALLDTLDIRIESAAAAVRTSAARLARHSADAITQINDVVVSGLVRGQGWAKTANELRTQTGMLAYKAERIVRTESLSNNDLARRAQYAEFGVEYVQRVATQDDRVCQYCAYRAGMVYPIKDAPAALHPNDRCYNMPWKPEWQAQGLLDDEFFVDHRQQIRDKLKAEGRKPLPGAAPFEKAAGLKPPRAVWTPTIGLTKHGLGLIGSLDQLVKTYTAPTTLPKTPKAQKPPATATVTPQGKPKVQEPTAPAAPKPAKANDGWPPADFNTEDMMEDLDALDVLSATAKSPAQLNQLENLHDVLASSVDKASSTGNFPLNLNISATKKASAGTIQGIQKIQGDLAYIRAPGNFNAWQQWSLRADSLPTDLNKLVGTTRIRTEFGVGLTNRSGGALFDALSDLPGGTQSVRAIVEVRVRKGATRGMLVNDSVSGRTVFINPINTQYRIVQAEQVMANGQPYLSGGSRVVKLVVETIDTTVPKIDVLAYYKNQIEILYGKGAGVFATPANWASPKPPPAPPAPKQPAAPPAPKPAPKPASGGSPAPSAPTSWTTGDPMAGYQTRSMMTQSERTIARLPSADAAGLRTYTGGDYTNINGQLRGRMAADNRTTRTISAMDRAFASPAARLDTDVRLFRGYSIPKDKLPSDPRRMIGTVLEDKGFVSTSTAESVADGFVSGYGGDKIPVKLVIRGRAGDRAIPVESISKFSREREVLYNRGSRFRVVDVRISDVYGRKIYEIAVEAVR